MDFTKAVEFFFKGEPVGLIDTPRAPAAPGNYLYEPYRGPGHYKLCEALRQLGPAECSCMSGTDEVLFVVNGIESGHLIITKVCAPDPSGAA